jgi:hypothetical protein
LLGRAAWTVELAPPAHKPHPLQLVIDAETGLVLQQRNDGFGSVDEWVEFVVGEPLDADLFTWDGPARSESDERARREAEHEVAMAARTDWFRTHIADLPLQLNLEATVQVHHYDEETGAFTASINGGVGLLERRPTAHHSDPEPRPEQDGEHTWTSGPWTWTVAFHDLALTELGLRELKRQLGAPDS